SDDVECRVYVLYVGASDAEISRIEVDRQVREILTVVRQADAAVRPVTHGERACHAVARQAKAQPQLRGKVPARRAQGIRLGFSRHPEAEESLDRAALEQLPPA